MKKTLLLSLLWLSCLVVHAQIEKKSYLTLSLGPSIPIGELADKNLSKATSGSAGLGGFADLNYSNQFSKIFGFTSGVRFKLLNVEKQNVKTYFNKFREGSVHVGPWTSGSLLAGVFQKISVPKKSFFFQFREMAGIQYTRSSLVSAPGYASGGYHATSFAYQLGFGINFQADENNAVRLFVDYDASKPTFEDASLTPSTGKSQPQQFHTLNLSIGLYL